MTLSVLPLHVCITRALLSTSMSFIFSSFDLISVALYAP